MPVDKYTPVFSPEEEELIEASYADLREAYLNSNHRKKVEIIDKAFTLARIAHGGVRRRSGEPYILHPIAVARIVCVEMGLGSTSISCALLHDVVEDTDYGLEEIRNRFGDKIALVVDGLTKISNSSFADSTSPQADNMRKLLIHMSEDARVGIIKIADRLHNMRTLASMPQSKQYKIIGETQFMYIPLAHRLGLNAIKTELDDLCFMYEHPEAYAEIGRLIEETEHDRQQMMAQFSAPIRDVLESMKLEYELKMRVKNRYSIWRKMQTKGIPFREVYDLFAIRIIFESKPDVTDKSICFAIYSAITDIYRNVPDRFRDWINTPKSNGYQALHITVLQPSGMPVEIQIRSHRMDDIAEQGLAAHWRYKSGHVEEDTELDHWINTIRGVLQEPTPDAMDFLDNIKLTLYANEVTVFTPRGDTKTLPAGATVVDFAYAIHSGIGDRCIGAKIDHRTVPGSTVLSNGDQVEIISSKASDAKREWLDFVVTSQARIGIQNALKRQKRERTLRGEEVVAEYLGERELEMTRPILDKMLYHYGFENKKIEDLYYAVAMGDIQLDEDLERTLRRKNGKKERSFTSSIIDVMSRPWRKQQNQSTTIEPEHSDILSTKVDRKKNYTLSESSGERNYMLGKCCYPVLGDEVLGYIDEREHVIVHKRTCPEVLRLKTTQGDRLISTEWGIHPTSTFDARIVFNGRDAVGILHHITQILLEDCRVNIRSMNVYTMDDLFEGEVKVAVHSASEIDRICQLLRRNSSIMDVHRVADEVR